METVVIIALILGAWGMVCIPLVFWARKAITAKLWYWKNKGDGGKLVDYYTSDGDHDVFCVKPDANGAFKLPNGRCTASPAIPCGGRGSTTGASSYARTPAWAASTR
jgi:hypothetical protein